MESKDELKTTDTTNGTCYYFDYTIGTIDINFRDISLDEKYYENILIYSMSYKTTFMDSTPMRIRFNEIDGFIKIYDGIRYSVFYSCLYDKICNRIKYLIGENSGITDSVNYIFAKIGIDSCNSLPIEKILTYHDLITLSKSVVNVNKNNLFLEKGLYKDKSNTRYF